MISMKLLIFYIYHLNAFFSYSLTLIDALDTLLVSTGCILISNLTTVKNWMTTIHVKIKLRAEIASERKIRNDEVLIETH